MRRVGGRFSPETADMRTRVSLQRLVTSADDAEGARSAKPERVATVWGKVEDVSGRDFWEAQKANAEISTRVTIRYRTGLEPPLQIVSDQRVLDLIGMPQDPTGRREWLILMCREVS